MVAGQGYQVATTRMSGPAKELDGCGDDAETIRKAVAPVACYPQDVLGGEDSAAAFNAFASAWEAETRTLRDALEQAGVLEVPTSALLPGPRDQHHVVAPGGQVAHGADGAVHPGAADRREMAGDK